MDGVVILVGTETGTAEDMADELGDSLAGVGVGVEVVDLEDAGREILDGSRVVVICTATQGDGELPMNSWDFFEALEKDEPDLSGVSFCVCGLGDSAYADFCEAGRIWSRTLSAMGATEIAERYEIDGFPNEEDVQGAREWVLSAADSFDEVRQRV